MGESDNGDDIDQRILKAAEAAFIRYGFDKTTLNDIAQDAKIARSTLYSRWKKKETLFVTLLVNELERFTEGWLALVEADPQGGTFAGIFKNALIVMFESPFITALYKNDRQVMGSFVHKMSGGDFYIQRLLTNQMFLQQLQQVGIVRADLDVASFAYITNCLHYGLLRMSDMIPQEHAPPVDAIMASLVEAIERMVAPETPGDNDAGKQVIRQYAIIARQGMDNFRKQFT
jgi:TetR/AcrR family acrAB operon transcriptional repressor